jgi:hypothetical protein
MEKRLNSQEPLGACISCLLLLISKSELPSVVDSVYTAETVSIFSTVLQTPHPLSSALTPRAYVIVISFEPRSSFSPPDIELHLTKTCIEATRQAG